MSRLGALRERQFRLLFAGRTISMAGSAMAPVALAFAALGLTGSTTDLGFILASRQIPVILLLLFGGVWADRLPRHHVMVVSNLISGASQAAAAVLLLTGHAQIWHLAALAALNGASSAFFFTASTGVIPQTVAPPMLQQANAILRLALNGTNIAGAVIGGILVAATRPGVAIAVDAVSYGLAAACIAAMSLPAASERVIGSTVFHELREGWRDFWSRTWLWVIVLQFGIVNATESGAVLVLGPGIAKRHLGGPAAWGAVLTATSVGLILCGMLMLRWRPRRILFVATLAVFSAGAAPRRTVDSRAPPARDRRGVHGRLLRRDLRGAVGHVDAARRSRPKCSRASPPTTRSDRGSSPRLPWPRSGRSRTPSAHGRRCSAAPR